mmetsp:Transcript_2888/g.6215  ORF Transcript_2888/g.6215 Transcript_2888/m.6215 type:complete len:100 (+) Transcript_2888:560-859(+)
MLITLVINVVTGQSRGKEAVEIPPKERPSKRFLPPMSVEFRGDRATGPLSGDLDIVAVGEMPNAESQGDDNDQALDLSDKQAIQNVCGTMSCVVILISG